MDINRRHVVGGALGLFAGAAAAIKLGNAPALAALPANATPRVGTPLMVPANPVMTDEPVLLKRARAALDRQGRWIEHRDRIGVVDFSQPSREARFQLINLHSGRVEETWLVA